MPRKKQSECEKAFEEWIDHVNVVNVATAWTLKNLELEDGIVRNAVALILKN